MVIISDNSSKGRHYRVGKANPTTCCLAKPTIGLFQQTLINDPPSKVDRAYGFDSCVDITDQMKSTCCNTK